MKKDKNKFIDMTLGIEITKPDHWEFTPGAWVDHSKERISELNKLTENGVNPLVFGIMYKPEELEIYPTVQCRLSYNQGKNFSEIKNKIFESMNEFFHKIEIVEDTDDFLLSKKLCSLTKFNITMLDSNGDPIKFQSQQIVITYPRYFIMISFSGPLDGPYSSQDDFVNIMRSIKLMF